VLRSGRDDNVVVLRCGRNDDYRAPVGLAMFEAEVAVSHLSLAQYGPLIVCPYFQCSELREITCQLFAVEKIADVVGDAAVFVSGDDLNLYGTRLVRDGGGVALIGFVVDG